MRTFLLPACLAIASVAWGADKDVVTRPTSNVILEFCAPVVAPSRGPVRAGAALATLSTGSNWSDPATWGGTVPPAGSNVVIPAGMSVIIDTDINPAALTVNGAVDVARKNINITSGYILVPGGKFTAGTVAEPFANYLTITLTGADRAATPMGGRVFGAMAGGKIELIGKIPAATWTMLNATAQAGDTSLTLEAAPGWSVGDEIIVTSTSTDYLQTEKRTITAISGTAVTLDAPLAHAHNGVITTIPHNVTGVPTTIDERAEVGLLTHRIKIQGATGIAGIEDSETNGYGGHMMIMDAASSAIVQGVELYNMGQRGILGRYPIHWHNVGDGGANSYIKSSSAHKTFNRGMTVHKTNKLTLSDNVLYDTFGHGVFIEDGKEVKNVFTHNLVALVHKSPMDMHWDPPSSISRVLGAPGAFWITNPDNTFIDNAAAGTAPGGIGFWYDIYTVPRPGSISADAGYNPSAQPFGVFRGNRSHSASQPADGFREGGFGLWIEALSGPVTLESLTAFKNSFGQVWANKHEAVAPVTLTGARLSGNRVVFNGHILKASLAANGALAFDGYDTVGRSDGSVLANFAQVYQLRFPAEESVTNTTFINAPLIGNPGGFTRDDAESRFFQVANPEDSYGNGAPGMFTYSEVLTSTGAKNAASGAKGIASIDPLAWWTPGSMADFIHFGFLPDVGTPYKVFIQPAGKTRAFVTTANLGAQRTWAKPNASHSITFTGPVENETLILNTWEGSGAGRTLLLTLPAPSSTPIYSSVNWEQEQPVLVATSLSQFDSATGITVFRNAATQKLHVKLPTTLAVLTMAGYTISEAPPVPPANPADVDVFTYPALTSTANPAGIDTIVAKVQVKKRGGQVAPGVAVSFAWSGIVMQSATAVTNNSGIASFSVKAKIAGVVTGTVTGLSGTYDPAIYSEPVSRSITVQ